MTSYTLSCIGAWIGVAAFTFAAHLFGRFARADAADPDSDVSLRRARIGVAVSITGPLVVLLIGSAIAVVTGAWPAVGLGTMLAVAVAAAIGYLLAPR